MPADLHFVKSLDEEFLLFGWSGALLLFFNHVNIKLTYDSAQRNVLIFLRCGGGFPSFSLWLE